MNISILYKDGYTGMTRRSSQRRRGAAMLLALVGSLALALSGFAAARPAAAADVVSCDVDTHHLALDAEEQTALDGTNAYRAGHGLQPLRLSYTLTRAALWKSTDMVARHYAEHDDGFRTWMQRFNDCGYDSAGAYVAENLAGGSAAGAATLKQWQGSALHDANLLNPTYTAVGIKRVQSTDAYGWYWSMDLGSDLDTDLNAVLAMGSTDAGS